MVYLFMIDKYMITCICITLNSMISIPGQAGLIVVYANRGNTARLVAKYRPPMPVVALVVPHLAQRDNKWTLQGRAAARQSLIVRGADLQPP